MDTGLKPVLSYRWTFLILSIYILYIYIICFFTYCFCLVWKLRQFSMAVCTLHSLGRQLGSMSLAQHVSIQGIALTYIIFKLNDSIWPSLFSLSPLSLSLAPPPLLSPFSTLDVSDRVKILEGAADSLAFLPNLAICADCAPKDQQGTSKSAVVHWSILSQMAISGLTGCFADTNYV